MFSKVFCPGLLHFAIFFQIFETIRLKPLLNIPGLLQFFDIFCNSPGVSTEYHAAHARV